MDCHECGHVVADRDRFCGGCGAPRAQSCGRCGRPLTVGASYCTSCGAPQPQAVAAATEDRRRVSVLFADLVNFTPYAEQTDPELVRQLQHGFYDQARRVVAQHGGVIEKYIGDAVMALFGAPVATENDALRCVRAGLELQRAVGGGPPSSPPGDASLPTPDLPLRVGVATGEALVDVAAAHDGGQAIVAGDVVNVAARLQAVAPAGGVLVCAQTQVMTAAEIRYKAQPTVTLRGRSVPTEVWLALAPAPPPPVAGEPDPTPLVNREHELGLLTEALRRTVQDRTPQLVTVFGQAGIGKSRLVQELRQHADRIAGTPVVWHMGHCPPFGENVTYACLADIVRAETGLRDAEPGIATRARLLRAVRDLVAGPDAERLTDALAPLVGLPATHLPDRPADAGSAWRRFLVALATARGPTVLVFEDLHWADELMLRFIELLVAGARDVPLLVLGTARPELVDRDPSFARVTAGALAITLRPLREEAMARLYGSLLRSTTGAAARLEPLVELAHGNPLYAREYVRMLLDQGAVAPMPDSVHAVIANRLDLLPPADRAVLQAAAVVGMQFWPGAVAAALDGPVGPVEQALRQLEQREFVSEQPSSTMAGQREYRFGHVLVRDVCYQRLPRRERVARHARTADWLETLPQRRDTDLAEVLAHHRRAAYEIARTLGLAAEQHAAAARRSLYQAARRAYALHALDTAAGHTAQALALLPAAALLPAPAAAPEVAPELVRERLRLELLAAEIDYCQDRSGYVGTGGADRLRDLAQRLGAATPGPDPTTARAWTLLGQACVLCADRAAALEHLGRAVGQFQTLPDSREKVDAYAELGRVHMLSYECEPAMVAAGTAAAIAGRLGLLEEQALARITIATARYESGDPAGLAQLREITAHCRAHQLLTLRRATRNLAHVVREEGDWRRSEQLLAEGRRLAGPVIHSGLAYHSADGQRALFAGDLDTIAALDLRAGAPGTQWSELRILCTWVRLLRAGPGADHGGEHTETDIADAIAQARRGGFYRTAWPELAGAARCRALQDRPAEAAELLAELTMQWRKMAVIGSGEWLPAAAFAAAVSGPEPADALHAPLAAASHQTRWSAAARHTVAGGLALAAGDPAGAGDHHLAAAQIYQQVPTVTEQMLALALAADAFTQAGRADRAEPVLAQVHRFAGQRSAPGLLLLAEGWLTRR